MLDYKGLRCGWQTQENGPTQVQLVVEREHGTLRWHLPRTLPSVSPQIVSPECLMGSILNYCFSILKGNGLLVFAYTSNMLKHYFK